jgi:hypothetical protein
MNSSIPSGFSESKPPVASDSTLAALDVKSWEDLRGRAKKIKDLNDDWQRAASVALESPSLHVQFCRDVQLYNLYEAVLLVEDELKRLALEDAFIPLLCPPPRGPRPDLMEDVKQWHAMKREGVIEPKTMPDGLRPESWWTLREDMIRPINVRTVVDGSTSLKSSIRRVFETCLPPHESERPCQIALSRDLWEAVRAAPIRYRDQLCARFIKMFDIPAPPQPRTARPGTPYFPPNPREIDSFKIYVTDVSGNAWTWNCGWYRVDEKGNRLDPAKPPLGHATFRRRIVLATPEQLGQTSFRHTRPWGMWRKGSGRVAHGLYTNGTLILTDGLHAVVKFDDGVTREVVLANLHPVATRQPRKAPNSTAPRAKRQSAAKKIGGMALEDLLKMLE